MSREGKVRLDSLTSLRFFAALAVVVGHAASAFIERTSISNLVSYGGAGLAFFYALSGFVLTWSSSEASGVLLFYRRRFARIYPLHLLTWAAAFILSASGIYLAVGGTGGPGSLRTDAAALVLLQAWPPDTKYIFGGNFPSWSLSCEAFFYLVYPLVIPLVLRLQARTQWWLLGLVATAIIILPTVTTSTHLLYFFPPTRLMEFVAGIVLAVRVRDGWRCPISVRSAVALLGVAAVASQVVAPQWGHVAVWFAPCWILLAAAASSDADSRGGVLVRPKLRVLGEWSFALYMVHIVVLTPVLAAFGRPPLVAAPAVITVFALACVALSGVLHRFVERPAERALRGRSHTAAA